MKMKILVLVAVGCLGLVSQASAATRVWSGLGANNFWTNSVNWNGGILPVAGDDLVFPGTGIDVTSLNNTNTFPNKTPFSSITIGGTNYVLNGAAIYFANSAVTAINATNTAGTNTVNLGFLFDTADQTLACVSATAVLAVNGDIDFGPVTCFVNCGGEIRLSGSLSGGAGLTKTGNGKLLLNSPVNNSHSGTTTINAGTVELNGASPMIPGALSIQSGATVTLLAANQIGFGTAGAVTIAGSGLLNLNGFSDGIGSLTLTSGGDVATGAGMLTLGGNVNATASAGNACTISGNLSLGSATRTFTVNNDAAADPDLEITAVVSANAGVGLTKSAAGQMRLTAANSYNGDTTVSAGMLRVHGPQPASRVLLTGGTLAGFGPVGEIAGAGSGSVSPGASPGILSSSNLFLGAGRTFTVEINGTNAGSGYDQMLVNGGVTLGGGLLLSNTISPPFDSVFTIINNDGADLVTNTFAGLAEGDTVTNGTTIFRVSYAGGNGNDVTLTVANYLLAGVTNVWSGLGTNGSWSNPSNWVGNAVPPTGSAIIFPPGAPRFIVTNDLASLFVGKIIFGDGHYRLGGNPALLGDGILCTNTGASLVVNLDLHAIVIASQSIVPPVAGASLHINSNLTILAGAVLTNSGNNVQYNSFDGAGTFVHDAPGVLIFNKTNSHTGGTVLNGPLQLQSGGTLCASNAPVTISPDAFLVLVAGGVVPQPLNLNGTLSVSATATWTGNVVVGGSNAAVSVNGGPLTFAGALGGAAPLAIQSSGHNCFITSPGSYGGTINLSGVQLFVEAALPDAVISANALATLGGTGVVSTVSLNSSCFISPGNSAGRLTAGHCVFTPNSTLTLELNGINAGVDYDQLRVNGGITLSGGANLLLSNSVIAPGGQTFVIIDNDGTDAVTNTFLNLPEGSMITNNGSILRLSYVGGDGNDVTLTLIGAVLTGVTRTWDGGGTNNLWTNPTNWVGDVAPSPGDDLVFPEGTLQLDTHLNNFPVGTTFGSISLGLDSALHGNRIVLFNGIRTIGATSIDLNQVSLPLRLGASQTFTSTNFGLDFLAAIESDGNTLTLSNAATLNLHGDFSGAGGLVKNGNGAAVIIGAKSFTGPVLVNQGSLYIDSSTSLGAGPGDTVVEAGGRLELAPGIGAVPESLTLRGALFSLSASTSIWSGPVVFDVGSALVRQVTGSKIIFTAGISGSGGLIVSGGTLAINGAASHVGDTVVTTNGILEVNGAVTVSPLILYNSGGFSSRISGTGTVPSIRCDGQAVVSPGTNGPGLLHIAGNAALTNSTLLVDISGTNAATDYDQLDIAGTLTVFGLPTLNVQVSNTVPVGMPLTIVKRGVAGSSFAFRTPGPSHNLFEGSLLTNNGSIFKISYVGGDGNDITLTRISLVGPSLITSLGVSGGSFFLIGLGITNAPYVMQASTNLLNWSPIQTNFTDSSGTYLFADSDFNLFPTRFYRVQSP